MVKPMLPDGGSAFNSLIARYKKRAENKGMVWELTTEEFRRLTKENCYLCGAEPSTIAPSRYKPAGDYVYNGIDRVDNSKGYTDSNSKACCWTCNSIKKNRSLAELLEWIEKVHDNIRVEIELKTA